MRQRERFALPLVARELVELSSRPRTYLVRVVYATLLLLIGWSTVFTYVPSGTRSSLDMLGVGARVLAVFQFWQYFGLLLVLPAIACGAFTVEKERNTIGLLLMTRLGPWTILFEKFISRLLLAFGFLVVSSPLIAFCYALGGVTVDQITASFVQMLISAIYVLSISMLCSAYFRSTSGALLGSYLLLAVLRPLTVLLCVVAVELVAGGTVVNHYREIIHSAWNLSNPLADSQVALGWVGHSPSLSAIMMGLPWIFGAGLNLVLARYFLLRRAFIGPANLMKLFLEFVDRVFERANKNVVTRGVIVIPVTVTLPEDAPVAWRETTTRSLGQARYLIRILVFIESPIAVLCMLQLAMGEYRSVAFQSMLLDFVLWPILALVTCVMSAGLISGERSRQSLDVLCTTPITGAEIIRQKVAGINRLIWVLEVPLWTCMVFRLLTQADLVYFICRTVTLLLYPFLIVWIGMWMSLISRTSVVAIVRTLCSLLVLCFAPILLAMLLGILMSPLHGLGVDFVSPLITLSPLTLFVVSEIGVNSWNGPWALFPPVACLLSGIIHGWLLSFIRLDCLQRADILLGRARPVVDEVQENAREFEPDQNGNSTS